MRIHPLMLIAALTVSAAAQAQIQTFDISGTVTALNILYGKNVLLNDIFPTSFTGALFYNPNPTYPNQYIYKVDLDFGGVFGFQENGLEGGTWAEPNGAVLFQDASSEGAVGELSKVGINEFDLNFSNPSNGQQVANLHNLDLSTFQNDTLSIDMGGGAQGPGQGIVEIKGDFKLVAVPEPSDLALILGALLPIGLAMHRTRRRTR
jgi:hypothetical protein